MVELSNNEYGDLRANMKKLEAFMAEGREAPEAVLSECAGKIIQGKMAECVFLVSRDSKFLWAHKANLKQIGYEIKEVVGNYCYKLFHGRPSRCESPPDICPAEEALKSGSPTSVMHAHINGSGYKRLVKIIVYPLKNEKSKMVRFVYLIKQLSYVF